MPGFLNEECHVKTSLGEAAVGPGVGAGDDALCLTVTEDRGAAWPGSRCPLGDL